MTALARPGADEARTFREEGYFVLRSCIGPAELEALRSAADRAVDEEHARLARGADRYVPVSLIDDRYVVSGFAERDPDVRAFALGPLLAEVCRATIGSSAYLFSDTFVCKAPNNAHGWIWHQDSSYLDHLGCGHYPPNVSVWVALDDMTAENGSLRVIPFSTVDTRKVVRHDMDRDWTDQSMVDFGEHPNVLVEVPAGSLVAFDGALPHASDPNRTARRRRAYLVQFSRVPIEKDGKLVQLAVPLLVDGAFRGVPGSPSAVGRE